MWISRTLPIQCAVDQMWGVAARVVVEDSRFVVDDIRIFESNSTDPRRSSVGPSHLLSESFAGCDGTRWAGLATTSK
jgi:hypothetical protein